jgi:hypothetical protein
MRRPGRGRTIILFIVVPTAILAYGADVADRLDWINLSNRGHLILGWGQHKDLFFNIVNSHLLADYEDNFHLLLILHVPHSNIDPMTDTHIDKSSTYTITGKGLSLWVR